MSGEGVRTFDNVTWQRFSGKVVLVILPILLYKTSLWLFLNTEKAEETKESVLEINIRDWILQKYASKTAS